MIGLESFFRPRIATLAAPDGNVELVDGFTMVGTTGDLAFLERLYEADPNGQIANAAQAYDCTIVLALANECSRRRIVRQRQRRGHRRHGRRHHLHHLRRLPDQAAGR